MRLHRISLAVLVLFLIASGLFAQSGQVGQITGLQIALEDNPFRQNHFGFGASFYHSLAMALIAVG